MDLSTLLNANKYTYQALEKNGGNTNLKHGPTDAQLEYRLKVISEMIKEIEENKDTS